MECSSYKDRMSQMRNKLIGSFDYEEQSSQQSMMDQMTPVSFKSPFDLKISKELINKKENDNDIADNASQMDLKKESDIRDLFPQRKNLSNKDLGMKSIRLGKRLSVLSTSNTAKLQFHLKSTMGGRLGRKGGMHLSIDLREEESTHGNS